MKRLTYRDNEGRAQWAPELLEDNTPPPAGTKEKERPSYMDLYQRLTAIEDILGDEYDLDRLRELVQADREGRCVVIHPNPATESEYEIICRPLNPEYIHLRKVFEK